MSIPPFVPNGHAGRFPDQLSPVISRLLRSTGLRYRKSVEIRLSFCQSLFVSVPFLRERPMFPAYTVEIVPASFSMSRS